MNFVGQMGFLYSRNVPCHTIFTNKMLMPKVIFLDSFICTKSYRRRDTLFVLIYRFISPIQCCDDFFTALFVSALFNMRSLLSR